MVALDAAAAIKIEVIRTRTERTRIRISPIEIVVTEITAGAHTWPSVVPLYPRILCYSLPVLRSRLP
jgi:hypothetical protein